MKGLLYTLLLFFISLSSTIAQTTPPVSKQQDTIISRRAQDPLYVDTTNNGPDSVKIVKRPKHDPRKATRRSAILPGWGQAYNREYWKIPFVYGALGATAGMYIYNNSWYKRSKLAFEIRVKQDTSRYHLIHPQLEPLTASDIQFYRNQFRRDRDYSILYFLIAWGLNVVDATVFGHLKEFDVSDDLSLKIHPTLNVGPQTTAAVGFVLAPKSSVKNRVVILP